MVSTHREHNEIKARQKHADMFNIMIYIYIKAYFMQLRILYAYMYMLYVYIYAVVQDNIILYYIILQACQHSQFTHESHKFEVSLKVSQERKLISLVQVMHTMMCSM